MNKDLDTIYSNRSTGFDLSDFRVIARVPDREIEKGFKLAIIMYGLAMVITLVCIIQVIQGVGALVYEAHHQQVSDVINQNNPFGINPATGERVFYK